MPSQIAWSTPWRALPRRGLVLQPVVGELTRILSDSSLRPVTSTSRTELGAEILDDTSHGVFVPFGGNSPGDRSYAGLPRQRHPFSEFLTLSTV